MVVAASATPLPKTNTTAIVVSSPIALFLIFISFRPFPFVWGLFSVCPCVRRPFVTSRDYRKCGGIRGTAHLPDGTSLVGHLAHLWYVPGGQCTAAPEARRTSQDAVKAKFGRPRSYRREFLG